MNQDAEAYEKSFLEEYLTRTAKDKISGLRARIESIKLSQNADNFEESKDKIKKLEAKILEIEYTLQEDLNLISEDTAVPLKSEGTWILDFGIEDLLDDFSQSTFKIAYDRGKIKYCEVNGISVADFHTHLKNTQVRVAGYKIPRYLWHVLFEYQKEGVSWFLRLFDKQRGGILADDMGLGKTVQCIVFISSLIYNNEIHNGLIVCPATLIHQWMVEFRRFFPFVNLYSEFRYINRSGIYFASYSRFTKLRNVCCDFVILDEGHKIKNKASQISTFAKSVSTARRYILTGTPIQNNLSELWSLFDFINPNVLGSYTSFYEEFELPILEGGYKNASSNQINKGYRHSVMLRSLIEPFILRRLKSQVKHELPKKIEKVLFCSLTRKQAWLYKQVLESDAIHKVLLGKKNILSGIDLLRKVCNHPLLLAGRFNSSNSNILKYNSKSESLTGTDKSNIDAIETLRSQIGADIYRKTLNIAADGPESHTTSLQGKKIVGDVDYNQSNLINDSSKLIELHKMAKIWIDQGNKILIFTQTVQMLDIISESLRGYNYIRMDGGTPIPKRPLLLKQFNMDPSISLFLLTTRVGGLGLNLCSASRIIIYDPDWNPSTDGQAKERIWRYGQLKDVEIYRFICRNTIEEKIYQTQIFKDLLGKKVLSNPSLNRFYTKNYIGALFEYRDAHQETQIVEMEGEKSIQKEVTPVNREDIEHFEVLKELNEKHMLSAAEMIKYIRIREKEFMN